MTATAPHSSSAVSEPSRAARGSRRPLLIGVPARLLLAVLSAALLYLSFPPRPLWWLAPLAFTGIGLLLYRRRAWSGFGYGFVFAFAFNLAHLVWIEDFLGAQFGSAPWLALSAVMALFAAIACAAMTVVSRLPGAPMWMAALYVGQEALRSHWPINGFPWGRVAFSQPDGAFTSLASVGGAPLVGFAVMVCGFGVAQLVVSVYGRRSNHFHSRVRVARVYGSPVLFVVLPVLAGLLVWPTVGTEPTGGNVRVAVVQGNAPDVGLDLLGARETIRRNHLAESDRLLTAIADGRVAAPDLVIWPETATALAGDDPEIGARIAQFGVPALIGALFYVPGGGVENAVVAWDPENGPGQRYAKQELVPFAEYVPMRSIARWFTPFVDDTADMRSGTAPGVLEFDGATVGVAICYEAAYDYVSREAVEAGARLLVVPTNNAWYGPGEMSYQQLAMSRLRAVELGRAVVVAATSGVSAIVRPDGSVVTSSDLYTAESLVEEVPLRDNSTLAQRLGAWPGRILVGVGVVTLLVTIGFRFRGRTAAATRRGMRTADDGRGQTDQHATSGWERPRAGGDSDLQRARESPPSADPAAQHPTCRARSGGRRRKSGRHRPPRR